MNALISLVRAVLWLSVAAAILIAFAWPFVISPDPAQPSLRPVAVAVTTSLLASLAALLVLRIRVGHR